MPVGAGALTMTVFELGRTGESESRIWLLLLNGPFGRVLYWGVSEEKLGDKDFAELREEIKHEMQTVDLTVIGGSKGWSQ